MLSKFLRAARVANNDPNFQNVTLLLPGNGTNGAQNNTFVDSSANNFSISRGGNATQGTFTPYGDLWSNYFDGGTTTYLSIPSSTQLDIGTNQFTVEAWVFLTKYETSASSIFGKWKSANNRSYLFIVNSSGAVALNVNGGGWVSSGTVPLNSWNHVAITRDSNNDVRVFINGVVQSTTNLNTSIGQGTAEFLVGTNQEAALGAIAGWTTTGYISNARIVIGSALYTTNFAPQTYPLSAVTNTKALTCQSNRYIDNSSNAFAITTSGAVSVQRFSPFTPPFGYIQAVNGGSGYFDGAGDYVNLASNSTYAVASNNFTIEGWFYFTNATANANQGMFTNYTTYAVAGSMYFGKHTSSSGYISFWMYNQSTTTYYIAETSFPPANAWTHYALVRNGNTFTIYRNGVATASASTFTGAASGATNPVYIAAAGDGVTTTNFPGYISGFRIVNGTALYTANFTPPTAPPAAVANTALLVNFTNAGIIDNAAMNDLETVGNAQISTSVSKWGGGSMAFDGTGDYLVMPNSPNLGFGTGDFTCECFIYLNSYPTSGNLFNILDFRTSATAQYWVWNLDSSGNLGMYAPAGTLVSGTIPIGLASWKHIAITRTGGTIRQFVNGVVAGSGTNSNDFGSARPLTIASVVAGGSSQINGYIDDLRITKGVARYTANFTPPGPLPLV